MSLTGLITFIAGTKAKASEVNTNFNLVKSFVDNNESDIATNTNAIEALNSGKADINGNASNRFAVADAINNNDAINKETLFKYTNNSQRYLNGLQIAKTASDTISIQAGSAMDSTFAHIMILNTSASIQNTTQAVGSTYYVYLISKEDGTTECIISSESVTPSLPSGYLYYRQIGKYFTRSLTNTISMVLNLDEYIGEKYDYANPISYSTSSESSLYIGNTFTAESDGMLTICGGFTLRIAVDNTNIANWSFGDQGFTGTLSAPVSRGQTYSFNGSSTSNFVYARFTPKIKYTIS